MFATALRLGLLAAVAASFALPEPSDAARRRFEHEAAGHQTFASPQVNPLALSPDGSRLYVANTTSDSVDVIDTAAGSVVATVPVGIDPVAVAVRPDGNEVWVSNHVSDSVSVIDTQPGSVTLHQVVETVQAMDAGGTTLFDEPVGIAFPDSTKAYVALSSTNQIAVLSTTSYTVTGLIPITAQDPRALAVHDGLLYVAAFESHNQTQVSVCLFGGSPPDCTLGAADLVTFATNPNIPGADKNIVVNPALPDRDLFVIDVATDSVVETVTGVGTLLYGVAVDGAGRVFVTQADARNADNGLEGENLPALDNRVFLNRIARVDCGGGSCGAPTQLDLEPAPPAAVPDGQQLATPYGIAVSGDDAVVVATAAASSRVFTLDPGTGAVRDILDLGSGADAGQQIPRGLALRSGAGGAPQTAYVLNTLANSVAVVNVADPDALALVSEIPVGSDPTPEDVRRGRIAFNSAFASTSGTFSCASCHPDGNTDQLLWRIGGACFFGLCTGDDEARTTMPIRGLKDTLPLHWDGTLGDPFGGSNGAVGSNGSEPPDCSEEHECFVDLVNGSLAGVMCDQSDGCADGGELDDPERSDMAVFLAAVPYPPARERPMSDVVTTSARDGFADFFMDQGGSSNPNSCADSNAGCHELPLGTGTNSATLAGFDVPTMRGLNDRFLQFSLGTTAAEDTMILANLGLNLGPFSAPPSPNPYDPAQGYDELAVFSTAFLLFNPVYAVDPDDIFQMVEEGSTGYSGAAGRQVTLNTRTTNGAALAATQAMLDDLEAADARGVVNLRAVGTRVGGGPLDLSWDDFEQKYVGIGLDFTRAELIEEASTGESLVTVTARLRANVGGEDHHQPLIAPAFAGTGPTGDPALPMLPAQNPMTLSGVEVRNGARVFLDGLPVGGSVRCLGGGWQPACADEVIEVELDQIPSDGMHLLQLMNPRGLLSNELPICVGNAAGCL